MSGTFLINEGVSHVSASPTSAREERYVRGFVARLEKFCPGRRQPQPEPKNISFAEQAFRAAGKTNKVLPTAAIVMTFALKLKSEDDQIAFFSGLGRGHPNNTLRRLILGAYARREVPGNEDEHQISDIDLSHLDTQEFSRRLLVSPKSGFATTIGSLVVEQFRASSIVSPINCTTLRSFFQAFEFDDALSSIESIGNMFFGLKQRYWPLFGIDVLAYMTNLTDPDFLFEVEELALLQPLAKFWQLGAISAQLIILRAVNNFEPENTYFRENSDALLQQAGFKATVRATIRLRDDALPVRATSSDPIERAVLVSIKIQKAIDDRSVNYVLMAIRAQVEIDSSILAFFDWDKFCTGMPLDWGDRHLTNVLISIVMLDPSITSRFERVALTCGRGFVSSQLITFASALKRDRKQLYHFARCISSLRPNAKRLVAEFVSQKTIIERYYFSFNERLVQPSSTKGARDQQVVSFSDLEVCTARSLLSLYFEQSKTLPAELCNRMLQEEAAFRKMHRFQQLFRNGRIRIDWPFLEREIVNALDLDFGFLFRSVKKNSGTHSAALMKGVSGLVASRIADIALFESSASAPTLTDGAQRALS